MLTIPEHQPFSRSVHTGRSFWRWGKRKLLGFPGEMKKEVVAFVVICSASRVPCTVILGFGAHCLGVPTVLVLEIGNAEVYSVHQHKVRETDLEAGRQIKFAISPFPAPSCGSSKLVWLVLLRELPMITRYLSCIKKMFWSIGHIYGRKKFWRNYRVGEGSGGSE